MRVSDSFYNIPRTMRLTNTIGTLFIPQMGYTTEMIYGMLIQTWNGSRIGTTGLADNAAKLLQLYPDDPAVGSPYNTGSETFGIPGFKRIAAIRKCPSAAVFVSSQSQPSEGDIAFHSQRREWMQTASRAGVKTWGYHFTQPQPNSPAVEGGENKPSILT